MYTHTIFVTNYMKWPNSYSFKVFWEKKIVYIYFNLKLKITLNEYKD